ncbi:MAG: SDR family oxidoreductase [Parvularculaceae bacterium]|nr:SDR family oxidoreductase [Parvularculaceae bacterium]
MDSTQKTAVVTGVSTGIGRAIAKSLIDDGWRVFGSVRKESDAHDARAALGEALTPLAFDVTDRTAIDRAAQQVKDALGGRTLDGLVNNAGVAVAGPLRYLNLDDLQRQIDINVYGPIRVTQAFLAQLGADHSLAGAPGRIVNMGSVAGKMASPFMAPYAISKHALEAMSESLRRELIVHGIDVVIIGPGAIRTPIWSKSDELDVEQYKSTEYYDVLMRMRTMMQTIGEQGLPPEDVGKLVLGVLTGEKRKTRYAILRNKLMMWTLPNLLPKRLVDNMIAKRFGLERRSGA